MIGECALNEKSLERQIIDEISNNLEQQTLVYGEIYELSERKQKAIVQCDAPVVDEIVKQEWALLASAQSLEDHRIGYAKEFARLRDAHGEPTIEQICACIDTGQAKHLREKGAALSAKFHKQSQLNRINSELLELQFQYYDHMLRALSQSLQPSNLYGAAGMEKNEVVASLGILNSEV